ncbi:MAG: TIM barrel protein [Bacillota bacterium]|jgi:deoxyribonuclease-4
MNAYFGTAGNPGSFYAAGFKSSVDMPAWLREQGLNAYEYQCVKGVYIKEETARKLGEAARANGIKLSIHAPYYISLATEDPDIRAKTRGHVLKSVRAADWMGAKTVVLHPGGGKLDRSGSLRRAMALLAEMLEEVNQAGLGHIRLAPETMGKANQLGNLEEILELCALGPGIVPAVDFGHLHAAGAGALNSEEDFAAVLDRVESALGLEMLKRLHVHFSPVEFTRAGEKCHRTTLDEGFGPDFAPLARLIAARGLSPTIICESRGRQAEDAIIYRDLYLGELAKNNSGG